MKNDIDIDELLNSYIDGELTERQKTEVQRLISHDPEIAKRLAQLKKCRLLVASLHLKDKPYCLSRKQHQTSEKGQGS